MPGLVGRAEVARARSSCSRRSRRRRAVARRSRVWLASPESTSSRRPGASSRSTSAGVAADQADQTAALRRPAHPGAGERDRRDGGLDDDGVGGRGGRRASSRSRRPSGRRWPARRPRPSGSEPSRPGRPSRSGLGQGSRRWPWTAGTSVEMASSAEQGRRPPSTCCAQALGHPAQPSAPMPTTVIRRGGGPPDEGLVPDMGRDAIVIATGARCPDDPAIGDGGAGRKGESGKPVRLRHRPAAVNRALAPREGLDKSEDRPRARPFQMAKRAGASHATALPLLSGRRVRARRTWTTWASPSS